MNPMRTLLVLALIAALSLPGCTSDPDPGTEGGAGGTETLEAGDQPAPQVEPEPEAAPESGTDPHGEPQAEQSAVTAEQGPNGTWTANYTVTFTNGVGDLLRSRTSYGASSGHVTIVGEERGGYQVVVNVRAQGATEDLARQNLESATVAHTDQAEGGTLVLSTSVAVDSLAPPVPGLPEIQVGQPFVGYSFDVLLPSHMAHDVSADASSGSVLVSDLRGPAVDADASSGSVTVERVQAGNLSADASSGAVEVSDCVTDTLSVGASSGSVSVSDCTADRLDADSSAGKIVLDNVAATEGELDASSGKIAIDGAFATLSATTSSGSISATLTPTASGTYRFDASSGSIAIDLAPGAYDVEAGTSSGSVELDIPDSEEVGEQERDHAHVRSRGFEDAAIQTTVAAEASSGSVSVSAEE